MQNIQFHFKFISNFARNWKKVSLPRAAPLKVASTNAASEETKSSATSVDSAVPSLSVRQKRDPILWTLPSGKFSSEKNQVFYEEFDDLMYAESGRNSSISKQKKTSISRGRNQISSADVTHMYLTRHRHLCGYSRYSQSNFTPEFVSRTSRTNFCGFTLVRK